MPGTPDRVRFGPPPQSICFQRRIYLEGIYTHCAHKLATTQAGRSAPTTIPLPGVAGCRGLDAVVINPGDYIYIIGTPPHLRK